MSESAGNRKRLTLSQAWASETSKTANSDTHFLERPHHLQQDHSSIVPVSMSLWGHLFKNYHSSVVTSVLNVAGLVWEHRVWGCGSASPVYDQFLASNYLHNGTNDTRHPRKKWILGKGIWSSGCLRTLLPHWPICFPYGIINSLT